MYVESVSMTDFRCFEKAETTFVYPGSKGMPEDALKNVTLLIGINGAGKTSLLKAVALGVLSPILGTMGYRPYYLVRHPASSKILNGTSNGHCAIVSIKYRMRNQDTEYTVNDTKLPLKQFDSSFEIQSYGKESSFEKITIHNHFDIKTLKGIYHDDESPAFLLLGYGATRRTEAAENIDSKWSRNKHPRYRRVAGLFEEDIVFLPIITWYFPIVNRGRIKEIKAMFSELLPESTKFTGEFLDNDAIFSHEGVMLPLSALSDGYRSYIGLIADLLGTLHSVTPLSTSLKEIDGVVMIDDIDVHLHPGRQREIVPKLAETFPKLQFIITTHSPLVVGTVHAANIRVVEDNQIHQYTEVADGRSADQLLMSSYFGHISPRSPATVDRLDKKAKRVADTGDPTAAIEFLRELTGKRNGKKL